MTTPTRFVYIAGPYRAGTPAGVGRKVGKARALAYELFDCAPKDCPPWVPIVPHAIGFHLDPFGDHKGDAFWLKATADLLTRCDALYLMPGWEKSSGSRAEKALAEQRGIPVYETPEELYQGLKTWGAYYWAQANPWDRMVQAVSAYVQESGSEDEADELCDAAHAWYAAGFPTSWPGGEG